MPYQRFPLSIQTLYQQLLERVVDDELSRHIGHLHGTFVSKMVKGRTYRYLQYREAGVQKQLYLGGSDTAIESAIARFKQTRPEIEQQLKERQRLCAMLRRGGMSAPDAGTTKVLAAFVNSGVFKFGAVLVGTHAFQAYANVLGVQWASAATRTQDIDLAQFPNVALALPSGETGVDLPSILEHAEMGFVPIPMLSNRDPSTSFRIRGQEIKIDLLAPLVGKPHGKPLHLPALKSYATPLRFLDYLIETPISAVLPIEDGLLVRLPEPARFAWHKLIVACERPTIEMAKRNKDLLQAELIFELFLEGQEDRLALAWEDLAGRGLKWQQLARRGLAAIQNANIKNHIATLI